MDNLQILWVAKSYTLPDAGIKAHSHPFCHLLLVAEGEIVFTAASETRTLDAGKLVLVPDNICHAYENRGQDICQYTEIKFVPDHSFGELFAKTGVIWSEDALAVSLGQRIVMEYDTSGKSSDTVTHSYLRSLLNVITEPYRKPALRGSQHMDTTGWTELSKRIVEYLEKHYSEDVSLDDLAEELDYNKTYLCKAFHADTGTTILDSLNLIRIRCAAAMLTYSDQSLSHVASACGFSSESHFNRVFRKYAGITPGQCRRAYPAGILFDSEKSKELFKDRPGRFMRSILAGQNY